MLEKIISGGQTGVDRAALDAALALGIDVGGWCPKGRRALDGSIPSRYPLKETPGVSYKIRTLWIDYCEQLGRPYEVYQLKGGEANWLDGPESTPVDLVNSLNRHSVKVLNVAGPREERFCPIYDRAYPLLHDLFRLMQDA
jgi:hypothetical protein